MVEYDARSECVILWIPDPNRPKAKPIGLVLGPRGAMELGECLRRAGLLGARVADGEDADAVFAELWSQPSENA
jgi:hypothetical protein